MTRRAFTLIELLIVVAIIALLIAILLPALGDARRSGKMAICATNMKQLGTAAGSYGADHDDRIVNFSWRGAMDSANSYTDYEGYLKNTHNDPDAAMIQSMALVRRFTGRDLELPRDKGLGYPYPYMTPIVLGDYLSGKLPEKAAVCPEDKYRLLWQSDPVNYRERYSSDLPIEATSSFRVLEGDLFPYSSSYEVTPGSYDTWQNRITGIQGGFRAHVLRTHRRYTAARGGRAGERQPFGKVQFPSQKVFFMDLYQRHFGKDMFYAHREARQPLLFFDGAVDVRQTQNANKGWDPTDAESTDPAIYDYEPEGWEVPLKNGSFEGAEEVEGYYRFTRGGLLGVDFGSDEIDTGQR